MAEKISSSKYELIQETIANPEFKSKLSNILKEMSANDLASLIQNSPNNKTILLIVNIKGLVYN